MRTIIVEDSRLARQELTTLLQEHSDITVVAEAVDIPDACAAIENCDPDLLLLDIQLPSGTGFELLNALTKVPPVIFTTAYDQHAVKAFEANALDYLVKPVDPARLARALDRARQQPASAAPSQPQLLQTTDLVFVRDGERCWFVRLGEIHRVEVDGNYAQVYFRGEQALLARSLASLASRFDPALFFRANRNTLVNLQYVDVVEPWVNDGYRLRLRDGAEVEVSRRQARELRDKLAL